VLDKIMLQVCAVDMAYLGCW